MFSIHIGLYTQENVHGVLYNVIQFSKTPLPVSAFSTPHPIPGVPYPQQLQLDRQLTNSVLISWRAVPLADVQGYQVSVDGETRMSVSNSDRTKALLEGLSSAKVGTMGMKAN